MKRIYILFLFFAAIVTINSQSVRASVESSEVYLGQPFEYRIIIEGTTSAEAPDLEEIDGFNIQYKGASTSMISSFGNGSNSSSKTVTYSWSFTPLRKGSLLIPSINVDVEGKSYKTASGTIRVKDPEPIDGFYLFLETEKSDYWLGEPINLNIVWLFSSSVSNPVFNLPFIDSGLFTIESQSPPQGNDVYKLNINGLEVLAMQSARIHKGKQYSSLSFSLRLVPEKPGNIPIGPITLAFDSAERSSGFRSSYKSVVIPSNTVELLVKDLPGDAHSDGQAIILSRGDLIVESAVTPDRVHIGDPLTYIITVQGAVTPENVELPSLNSFSQMALNFSIPERKSQARIDGDTVSFTQTIRVKNDSISSVPELNLKYFDIQSGKVGTVGIPSVPIEVLKTEVVTSANLESTGYTATENNPLEELVTNDAGMLYNFDTKLLLDRYRITKLNVIKNPLYWILLFLPVSIYLFLAVFKNRKKIMNTFSGFNSENTDFSKIYNELIKNNINDVNLIKNEINKYLLDYCSSDGQYLTPEEIYMLLLKKNNDAELSMAVKEILLSFDCSEYSREKETIDGAVVLNKFYSLSREFK